MSIIWSLTNFVDFGQFFVLIVMTVELFAYQIHGPTSHYWLLRVS